MKKRRKRKLKSWVIILVVIILLGITSFVGYKAYNKYLKNNNNDKPNTVTPSPTEVEKHYEASVIAVGDNLIHGSVYRDANRHAGGNGYGTDKFDFKPMIKYIKEIVSDYDIAYYNQETILGGTSLGLSDYPTFNSPQETGDDMLDAGFNLVSLATNHTMDKGKKAVLNSCEYWNKQTNVLTAGSYCSLEERNEIKIAEKNNITYTMLNYTYGTNGIVRPSGYDSYVNIWDMSNKTNYENYKEQVKKDIEAIRDKVDVLIVAMHWGIEYINMPNDEEKEIAEYLSSLGVDIIIGNHPHILQPITKIGDTIVMYSLGNFISNQYGGKNGDWNKLIGFMATLDITKTVTKDKKVKMSFDNLGGELIFTKYNGNPVTTAVHDGHTVIPFSMMKDDSYLKDYERLYKKYTGVLTAMGENLNIAPLGSKAN